MGLEYVKEYTSLQLEALRRGLGLGLHQFVRQLKQWKEDGWVTDNQINSWQSSVDFLI